MDSRRSEIARRTGATPAAIREAIDRLRIAAPNLVLHDQETRMTDTNKPRRPRVKETRLDQLHGWDDNPRAITPDRMTDLKHTLERMRAMLDVRPLVALPDGTVIMGNHRLLAARELAWKTIPCAFVDIDENTARTWALNDNNGYADWETDALARMLRDMSDLEVDLALTGFAAGELEQLLADTDPPPDPAPGPGGPYGVTIVCRDATHQAEVYNLLTSEDAGVAARLDAVDVQVMAA